MNKTPINLSEAIAVQNQLLLSNQRDSQLFALTCAAINEAHRT